MSITCPKCNFQSFGQAEVHPDGSLEHKEGDLQDGLGVCPGCGGILVIESGHVREATPEYLDHLERINLPLYRSIKAISTLCSLYREVDPNRQLREEVMKEEDA